MAFRIIRNDIASVRADAIVNTANPRPVVGGGVDTGIHRKAGPELLEARKRIGPIRPGQAALTPGFRLPARFVIHAVAPVWQGGDRGETELLEQCYTSALQIAADAGCESVAFPLMGAGSNGFPGPEALRCASAAIGRFLLNHEMLVTLVVFRKPEFDLSVRSFASVKSFLEEARMEELLDSEYGPEGISTCGRSRNYPVESCMEATVSSVPAPRRLEDLMDELEEGFSQSLLRLIDRRGLTDPQAYKKANVDRKLFSKIKNNPNYQPSKVTAVAFALALELNLDETRDLLGRAGYAMSRSSKFDLIIEYFIREGVYDLFEINETLFAFDQPLIGG